MIWLILLTLFVHRNSFHPQLFPVLDAYVAARKQGSFVQESVINTIE